MTVYLFAGPSLPRAERERHAARAVILPPVAAGDLLRLGARRGDVVAIVDGFFHRRPAVRHKEILDLLASGVRVYGAASMGALRAAELAAFGMRGHGRIFADYHRGAIVADDEVALLHGDADEDYRPCTEALVNVRYALADAVAGGRLPAGAADAVLSAAARLPFTERTREAILDAARRAGVADRELATAEEVIRSAPDVKRQDALALLDVLFPAAAAPESAPKPGTTSELGTTSRLGIAPGPGIASELGTAPGPGAASDPGETRAWRLRETRHLREWRSAARGRHEPGAGWVAEEQVHRLAQVLAADYPVFREEVALRVLAAGDGLPPDADAAQLRARVIAGLRERGLLAPGASADPGLDRWCTAAERDLPDEVRTCRAAARALFPHAALAWDDPFLAELRARGAYRAVRERLVECLRFHRELRRRHPTLRLAQLRADNILAHFARRWGRADLADAVLERGFATVEDFVAAARPFYLYDKARPDAPPLVLPASSGII